jgi:hypothetical protein
MICEDDGLCARTTSDHNYRIVRGGSTFPNAVEMALANAVLSGDIRYLDSLPGGPGLPMQYAMADVEAELGYREQRPGMPFSDVASAVGGAMMAGRGDDDDIIPSESIPRSERLEYTETPWDAAARARGLPATATWGRPETLEDHFQRHGADFGAATQEEYALMASEFLQRSQMAGLPTKVDANGVIRVYDPATNTFGAYNPNGTTRTFLMPNPAVHRYPTNLDYWNAQPGVSPWRP